MDLRIRIHTKVHVSEFRNTAFLGPEMAASEAIAIWVPKVPFIGTKWIDLLSPGIFWEA
jgi:hypothetical protein